MAEINVICGVGNVESVDKFLEILCINFKNLFSIT